MVQVTRMLKTVGSYRACDGKQKEIALTFDSRWAVQLHAGVTVGHRVALATYLLSHGARQVHRLSRSRWNVDVRQNVESEPGTLSLDLEPGRVRLSCERVVSQEGHARFRAGSEHEELDPEPVAERTFYVRFALSVGTYNVLHPFYATRYREREGLTPDGKSNWSQRGFAIG